MQTQAIVSRLLQCCVPFMHAARWRALHDVAVSAVCGKSLTLTALALGTTRNTNLRHRIKCVDRLLANSHLEKERVDAYRALAHEWLSGLPQLLIVVDWSPVTDDMQWHLLRASVVVDGRSITLFEEVHPRKHLTALRVHKKFVKQLATPMPIASSHPLSSPMQVFAPPGSGSSPNKADAGLVAPATATSSGSQTASGLRPRSCMQKPPRQQRIWVNTKRCATDR